MSAAASSPSPRVVFITGGASGIGAQCARLFASEGYHVVVADINATLGEALAQEISAAGKTQAVFANCNVTDLQSLEEAVALGVSKFGRLDVAIKWVLPWGGGPALGSWH